MQAFMIEMLQNPDYVADLTVRMAHHNTAIEGNTLTQDETASIILNGIIPKQMNEREFYEVKNYQHIIPFMLKCLDENRNIDNELMKEVHSILMDKLIYNKGQFKQTQNMIVGATFDTTEPYLVPPELKDWCDNLSYRLQNTQNDDDKLKIILDQHIKFERIHPFSDGNGRVGRFLMFYAVVQNGLTPFTITKQSKDLYIHCLRNKDVLGLFELCQQLQQTELNIIEKLSLVDNDMSIENDNDIDR